MFLEDKTQKLPPSELDLHTLCNSLFEMLTIPYISAFEPDKSNDIDDIEPGFCFFKHKFTI